MTGPVIIGQLRSMIAQLESGELECDMMTIITRDRETQIPTISSLSDYGVDESHELFGEMAACLDYAKVQ